MVEKSRKVERHCVGIWTVARSSADSSVEVPMKSKERQAQDSFSSQLIRLCCSFRWGRGKEEGRKREGRCRGGKGGVEEGREV